MADSIIFFCRVSIIVETHSRMANEDMVNIAIRVSLIVLAAIVVIFLITYYSSPPPKPSDQNSEKKGVEKFNTSGPSAGPSATNTPAVKDEQARPRVSFTNPVVTQERAIDVASTPYGGPAPKWLAESSNTQDPAPMDAGGFEDYIAVDYSASAGQPASCYPQDRTKPEDLLPHDAANSKWAQVAPAGQGDVKNQNFLTAGFHVGKDTIGVARKNPNLSLRAEPPNPKNVVSPWMNSSIEPDQYRRGFEIGSA